MDRLEFLSLEKSNDDCCYIEGLGLFEKDYSGFGSIHCLIIDDSFVVEKPSFWDLIKSKYGNFGDSSIKFGKIV